MEGNFDIDSVDNWKEMLVKVAKLMYEEKPSTMAYLASMDEWVHETDSKERSRSSKHR